MPAPELTQCARTIWWQAWHQSSLQGKWKPLEGSRLKPCETLWFKIRMLASLYPIGSLLSALKYNQNPVIFLSSSKEMFVKLFFNLKCLGDWLYILGLRPLIFIRHNSESFKNYGRHRLSGFDWTSIGYGSCLAVCYHLCPGIYMSNPVWGECQPLLRSVTFSSSCFQFSPLNKEDEPRSALFILSNLLHNTVAAILYPEQQSLVCSLFSFLNWYHVQDLDEEISFRIILQIMSASCGIRKFFRIRLHQRKVLTVFLFFLKIHTQSSCFMI